MVCLFFHSLNINRYQPPLLYQYTYILVLSEIYNNLIIKFSLLFEEVFGQKGHFPKSPSWFK